MNALHNLGLVIEIMFFSTIGTIGILLSFFAIPISVFLFLHTLKKSNKNKKGERI